MALTSQQRMELVESIKRCIADPEFVGRFYERLWALDPIVPAFFDRTDPDRQRRMVVHSLTVMARSGLGSGAFPADLIEVAGRHGKGGLDVPANLYDAWVRALVHAASRTDAKFTTGLMVIWEQFFGEQVAHFRLHAAAPARPAER